MTRVLGCIILASAIAVGFIHVDTATYMQWRLVFATGEGLAMVMSAFMIILG